MIGSAMAEFQFVRLAAERQAENLLAETDAENRLLADQLAYLANLTLERFGIARAVGEKNPIGIERQDVLGGRSRGHDRHASAGLHETAQNVPLDSVIIGDDVA